MCLSASLLNYVCLQNAEPGATYLHIGGSITLSVKLSCCWHNWLWCNKSQWVAAGSLNNYQYWAVLLW